jgi:hypothetical protein
VSELRSALDALVAEELHGLCAVGTLDRTAMLVAARNRIDAELAGTARHGDNVRAPERDGQKSMRSWLCGHARLFPAAADQIVRNGRVSNSYRPSPPPAPRARSPPSRCR